jgi:hypothetical protein
MAYKRLFERDRYQDSIYAMTVSHAIPYTSEAPGVLSNIKFPTQSITHGIGIIKFDDLNLWGHPGINYLGHANFAGDFSDLKASIAYSVNLTIDTLIPVLALPLREILSSYFSADTLIGKVEDLGLNGDVEGSLLDTLEQSNPNYMEFIYQVKSLNGGAVAPRDARHLIWFARQMAIITNQIPVH